MTTSLPIIAITSGEPAGIGPDIVLQMAEQTFDAQLVILGDISLLQARAQQLGLAHLTFIPWVAQTPPTVAPKNTLYVHPVPLAAPVEAGSLNPTNADYVLATLQIAAEGCLDGTFDAVATAPIHKGVINESGTPFSGHTEFFADICKSTPVMMLASGDFRVALATTHLPLSEVSQAITHDSLTQVIATLHNDLQQKFGIPNPTILVCGLNPHAGEGGHMGREEIDTIEPCLDQLRQDGLQLIGPLPADTLFTPRHLDGADAVLAMYHDQGLPVLKYAGFGNAINITLGLPIIRTSVDHGTALDLAASGNADANSLQLAIQHAIELAKHHRE